MMSVGKRAAPGAAQCQDDSACLARFLVAKQEQSLDALLLYGLYGVLDVLMVTVLMVIGNFLIAVVTWNTHRLA